MNKGKIIFLNGVSSTGKSTLSKTLQKYLDEPYHRLNVDDFIKFTDMSHHPLTYFEKGKDPVSIFPHVVKIYSDLGVNVIVDVAFMNWEGPNLFLAQEALMKSVNILHDYPLIYILVTCPYKEVKRRHNERGNRGDGKDLLLNIPDETLVGDTEGIYDLVVDTYALSIKKCADKIIDFASNNTNFMAFKKMNIMHEENIRCGDVQSFINQH